MADEFNKLFNGFVDTETCMDAIAAFERLCFTLGIQNTDKTHIFQQLSSKLTTWNIKSLMEKFKKRFSMKDYKDEKMCSKTRVLVVGAGPCGLRTAIEAAFLGCRVVLIEKRTSFTRNNVLHLWQFVVADLKNLGAKHFYGRFCCGGLNHICIKRLQLILLKIALILGVEIHLDVAFKGLLDPPTDQNIRSGWHFISEPSDHVVSKYEFDVLVGATGTRDALLDFDIYSSSGNIIKTQKGFERKEVKNRTAIAISANFVNNNTDAELKVEEWGGILSYAKPEFFKNLKKETQIDLENIVYFKSDTHYFVMTPTKQSLLEKGVFRNNYANIEDLMSRVNTDPQALMNFAKQAANHCTNYCIPSLSFAKNKDGKPDVAMIDFSTRYQSENASRVIERHGRRLLISLVGDSLLEPFWPSGTGCAKGFLGALDAAWMIKSWSNYTGSQPPIQILSEREHIFKFLPQTTMENLKKKVMDYTVDPHTRYQNLNLKLCKPGYARKYYTCDNEEYQEDTDQGINLDTILVWCKRVLNGRFKHVQIEDFSTSWRTGLALCALIYTFRPNIIDYHGLSPKAGRHNNQLAIDTAQRELGISACLSGKEIAVCSSPADDLKMSSYLFLFYSQFSREGIPPDDWSGYKEPELQKREIYQRKPISPVKGNKFFTNEKVSSGQSSVIEESVSNVCYFCKKHLYIMERMNVENIFFHRKCFKCNKCNCELSLDNYRMKKSSSGEVKFFCQRHADSMLSRSRRKGFFKKSTEKLKMSIRNIMNMQTSPEIIEAPEICLPIRPDFLLSKVSKLSVRAEFYNISEDMSEKATSEEVEKSTDDHGRPKGDVRGSSASANVEQQKVDKKPDGRSVPRKVMKKADERSDAPRKLDKKTDQADFPQKVIKKTDEGDTPGKVDRKTDERDVQGKVEKKKNESKIPMNTYTVSDAFDALQKFEDEKEESSCSLSRSEDDEKLADGSVATEDKQNKQDPDCVETLEKPELPSKEEIRKQAGQVEEKPHTVEVDEKLAKIEKPPRILGKSAKYDTPENVQEQKNRPDRPPRISRPDRPPRISRPDRPTYTRESVKPEGDIFPRAPTTIGKSTEDKSADNLNKSDRWLPPPGVEKALSRSADDESNEGSTKFQTKSGSKVEEQDWEVVNMDDLKTSDDKEMVTELAGANLQKTLRRNVTIGEAKNIFEKLFAGPTDPPPVQRRPVRPKSTPDKAVKLWGKELKGDVIPEENDDETPLQKKVENKKPEDIPPKVPPRTYRMSTPVEKLSDYDKSVIPARPTEVSPDRSDSPVDSDTDNIMTRDKDQIKTSNLDKAETETETVTRLSEEINLGGATSNVSTNSESSDASDDDDHDDDDEDEEITEALVENFGKTLRRNLTIDEARKIFDDFQKTKTLDRQENQKPKAEKPKLIISGRGEDPVVTIPEETFMPNCIPDILDKPSTEEQRQLNRKKFERAVKNLDDEKHEMATDDYRRKLWTTCYNPGKRNVDTGFDFKKKETENVSNQLPQGRPKLQRSNSDEADIRRAQRVQLAARKLARNLEQQRVNIAQEVKLQLEEAEVKLMEVEKRGVELERTLQDQSVDGQEKSNLMKELFTLTIRRNQLLQYEEELKAVRMQLDKDMALDQSMQSSFGKSSGVGKQKNDDVDSVHEDDTNDGDDDDGEEDKRDFNSDEISSDDDISKLVPKDSTLDDDISGLLPMEEEEEDSGQLILPQIDVDVWECPFCTLLNKNEANFCDACDAWRCLVCTLVNMINKKKCVACSQNQPSRTTNIVTLGSQRQDSYA